MDDPNITMEEYIRLEEEKAHRHGKVYNWETAKYGKIWYDEDVHDLRSVETEFLTIVFNDELSSEKILSCEPTVSNLNNNEIDFRISFDESDNEDYTVIFDNNSFSYKLISVNDLKTDLKNDNEKVNMPSFPSLEPKIWLFHLGIRGISILGLRDYSTLMLISWILRRGRMLMEHKDAQGQTVFTSQAWRRLFEIRGPLVHELILEFFSTFRFKEAEGMETARFGLYWVESGRQISEKGDLSTYWREISSEGDFLGTPPFYTLIRDPMLRLCHRLIACGIAGRSQTPEKVTVTDLFYLRGMDIGLVNIPYLLARYLRLFTSGRKQCAMISEGQFVARLADHFGLLTEERLQGLIVIVRDLPVIDMVELVRLQICMELDDTWAWVAPGPERQQVVVAGAAEDAPVADEGAPAIPAPMHEIRRALGE
ncbi:hypothetical protein Tco_0671097 [Tanacetum coccineum]